MDYTELYELDVKIGNRIGRRLRALGSTIEKSGAKIRAVTEPFDHRICEKARNTESMMEMNSKIWRLRKRYADIIVDEIMAQGTGGKQK